MSRMMYSRELFALLVLLLSLSSVWAQQSEGQTEQEPPWSIIKAFRTSGPVLFKDATQMMGINEKGQTDFKDEYGVYSSKAGFGYIIMQLKLKRLPPSTRERVVRYNSIQISDDTGTITPGFSGSLIPTESFDTDAKLNTFQCRGGKLCYIAWERGSVTSTFRTYYSVTIDLLFAGIPNGAETFQVKYQGHEQTLKLIK